MNKLASALFVASLIALPAAAQTWTGAGADNNWSTGANWSGGVAPASSPATQVGFPVNSAITRFSPVVDAPWTVNRIDVGQDIGGGYTFSGQAITLGGANPIIVLHDASLTASNAIVLAAPATFLSCFSSNLTVNGVISGSGPLTLDGRDGVVTLGGANTYAGGTTVHDVTLDLRGSILGPISFGAAVTTPCGGGVSTPGVLTGNGTVSGPVALNGANLVPNLVLNTGDLSFPAGSLSITINGPAQGTQYATVNVTGTVTLGGALQLLGSYTPVPGDVFTIITNDGSDSAVGTFAGLPEGATITFNGVPLRISYRGGTGNDVTLSAAAAVAPGPGSIAGVPTLSEWAMILLASMLAGIGVLRSRGGR